jgi:nanoRNase/pAp phosphatase (c-di-AMP/oligoRNAs hydrolase)
MDALNPARWLISLRGRKVILSTHPNADPDGVSSLIVLKSFLENIKALVSVILPEGLNEQAKHMIQYFNINLNYYRPYLCINTSYCNDSVLIVTDTNNLWRLGFNRSILNSFREIMILDHHSRMELNLRNTCEYVRPCYTSTAELVFDILKYIYPFSARDLTLLLAGLIYDTGKFSNATSRTFYHAYEMIRMGGSYSEALRSLKRTFSHPERIARLKAAQRLKIYTIGDIIVAVTHVGAYESSVAHALLELGADIAVVYSKRKNLVRITVRISKDVYERRHIDFTRDILPHLERLIKGKGGGHPTAGSVEGERLPSNVEERLAKILSEMLLRQQH